MQITPGVIHCDERLVSLCLSLWSFKNYFGNIWNVASTIFGFILSLWIFKNHFDNIWICLTSNRFWKNNFGKNYFQPIILIFYLQQLWQNYLFLIYLLIIIVYDYLIASTILFSVLCSTLFFCLLLVYQIIIILKFISKLTKSLIPVPWYYFNSNQLTKKICLSWLFWAN